MLFQKSEIWKPAIAGYYSIKSLTDLAHKNDVVFDVLFVQFHKITTYTSFTQFRISNSPLPVLYKYFKHFTRLNVSPICRKSCNIKCSELISILLFKQNKKKKRFKHILSSILSTTSKFKFNHDLSVTLIAKIIE